jgi:PIN domain nuclease of toxin-antitoxin system
MKLLLDTQSWLWLQSAPGRLDKRTLARLRDPAVELLLSAVSSWEIAIKYALGKLPLPAPPAEYVPDRMRRNGVHALEVTHSHALHVAQLPAHHRDPFDRLLIAQAQLDGLTIVTSDKVFDQYEVPVLVAD